VSASNSASTRSTSSCPVCFAKLCAVGHRSFLADEIPADTTGFGESEAINEETTGREMTFVQVDVFLVDRLATHVDQAEWRKPLGTIQCSEEGA
jgi:hypothetical protein